MGAAKKFLNEKPYKSLLTPLSKGRLPRHYISIPGKYKNSWAYKEPSTEQYFLGTFAPIRVDPHSTDSLHTVEGGEVNRPDVISYRHYKTPGLYWVILWVNGIADPFEAMYPGMVIRIPSIQRLMELGINP